MTPERLLASLLLAATTFNVARAAPALAPHLAAGTLPPRLALERALPNAGAARSSAAPSGAAPWIEQKVVAGDGLPYQQFGSAVAVDGAIAVVGGVESGAGDGSYPAGSGVAFVIGKEAGQWAAGAELRAEDGAAGDFFGYAVAVSGDTIVVGADDASVDGSPDRGAAYVFHYAEGVWKQVAKLTSDDGLSGDLFGNAVAVDGDTIVVGAYGATVGDNFGQGALYVFTNDGGAWTQTRKLTAADGAGLDQFGYSVALHGDILMTGAPNAAAADGTAGAGAVYVLERSEGEWSQAQKIAAADGALNDAFGVSVAFDGTRAVVSAPFGNGFLGAAYTFRRDGDGWTQTQKLLPENNLPNDILWGYAVAVSGDDLVVTEPAYDNSLGRADLYHENADGWTLQQTLTASDATPGASLADYYGYSAAMSGGTILIGQPYSTIGSNHYQGAAYFLEADGIFANGFQVP